MPAVAAYDTSYLNAVPYLTANEYKLSPTGVDTSALVTTGARDPQSQIAALEVTIARASAWADNFCQQVLAATRNTEVGRYRVNREGAVRIPAKYWPILEVDSVLLGYSPSTLQAISDVDLADVFPDTRTIEVPARRFYPGDRVLAEFSYVNGWAHGTLTTAAAATAQSIVVSNPLGIYAGTRLMVYDGASTEEIVAAAVPSGNTVTLTSALGFDHEAGVSVSALPPDVKQAVVLLTSCLIKTRGTGAMVMNSLNRESMKAADGESGAVDDLALAIEILGRYKRVLR